MKYDIRYKPSFATLFVILSPGESLVAEAGSMATMDAQIEMKTEFNGGFIPGLLKRLFGGESLFINRFTNISQQPQNLVITQETMGDMVGLTLQSNSLCLQPGAFIACHPGVKLGMQWAGFKSFISGEGLFRLVVSGRGPVFFGAYGGITKRHIDRELVVDTGHLVAYEPGLTMNIGLASGAIGSLTSGEGLVNRVKGRGVIYLQSRTISGLVGFLRPKV
ncbi:MAG: TIGR00266 family protein [Cyanobacteria bacterium J06648_11]